MAVSTPASRGGRQMPRLAQFHGSSSQRHMYFEVVDAIQRDVFAAISETDKLCLSVRTYESFTFRRTGSAYVLEGNVITVNRPGSLKDLSYCPRITCGP
eukprot:746353-Hanusia_phi.AAC.1